MKSEMDHIPQQDPYLTDHAPSKKGNFEIAVIIGGIVIVVICIFVIYGFVMDYYGEEAQNRRSAPGDYYKDFLTDGTYDEIYIEVDYVEGCAPRDGAMQLLVHRLNSVCDKDSITWHLDDSIPRTKEVYSHNNWQKLEDKYRDHFRDDKKGRAVMYFLYLNGEHGESASSGNTILAVTYHASSVVMFKEEIDDSSSPPTISEEEIERAVLVHETGHMLGLVNIVHTAQSADHVDQGDSAPNKHHCDHTDFLGNHDCVMYFMIESRGSSQDSAWNNFIQRDVPNDYCEDCRRDIQHMKDK